MQVSKFLWAVCATTVLAGFLSAEAQDTPAQAAARAALLQSMGQPAASAPSAPATPPPASKIPVAVEAPATPSAPAPAATTVVPASQPLDPQAQADARAALLQSMGQPATAPAVAATPPPAASVAPAPATTPVVTPPQPSDQQAQAAARAALLQAMGQTDIPATPPPAIQAPAVVAPVVVVPTPATTPATNTPAISATPAAPEMKPVATHPAKANNSIVPGKEPGFTPITAPPLPISVAKQQALDALLAQYKADQISPEEYQKQRAAILADP